MIVRDLRPADEAAWRRLWAEYIAFQGGSVAPHVTDHTWARLLSPARTLIGRVADIEGRVAGFSVSLLHEGTWATAPYCYLEDLYVDAAQRGHGIGHALISDLIEMGRSKGWERLYWHTRAGNVAARRLYDRFGVADDDVRYRLTL
jgi:GNAT superfamily N-acetyltransferase